jgi:hypothetical protein
MSFVLTFTKKLFQNRGGYPGSLGVKMKLDPVLAEIRAVREAYAEKFAGDIQAMLADIRERQREGGRKVISRPAKRITPTQEPALTSPAPSR